MTPYTLVAQSICTVPETGKGGGGEGCSWGRHYITHSKIIEGFALNVTCTDTAVRTDCTYIDFKWG